MSLASASASARTLLRTRLSCGSGSGTSSERRAGTVRRLAMNPRDLGGKEPNKVEEKEW